MKTSEAQKKASRTWEAKNREKANRASYFRSAKSFIRNHATEKELEEIKEIIRQKEEMLNKK